MRGGVALGDVAHNGAGHDHAGAAAEGRDETPEGEPGNARRHRAAGRGDAVEDGAHEKRGTAAVTVGERALDELAHGEA